jgi:hypothetical protein
MIGPISSLYHAVSAAAAPDAAAKINSYFTPGNLIIGLIVILVGTLLYYQWRWGKTCAENVQVLVVKSDGHGDYQLAPQQGGSVTLKNPNNDTTRLWPINKLSTIDVPYPGDGFVPGFLQKSIRQVVVDEEDWEPLLNRSPYKDKVASPDVVQFLQDLAVRVNDEEMGLELTQYAEELSPSPTREMIASPAVLGNLINEKVTEAVITVNKETLDTLTALTRKIGNILSANTFYICIGIVALLSLVTMILSISDKSAIAKAVSDLSEIKTTLGIKEAPSQ